MRLPGISDRPQLVVRTGPQTVRILEFDRWAEPLDDLVPRVLAQDLAQRQGVQAGNGPASRIYVVIDEFMTDDTGSARLAGRWRAQPSAGDSAQGRPRAFDFAARLPQAQARLLRQPSVDCSAYWPMTSLAIVLLAQSNRIARLVTVPHFCA